MNFFKKRQRWEVFVAYVRRTKNDPGR